VSSVGSFFSYVNDARSHEPEVGFRLLRLCQCVSAYITVVASACPDEQCWCCYSALRATHTVQKRPTANCIA